MTIVCGGSDGSGGGGCVGFHIWRVLAELMATFSGDCLCFLVVEMVVVVVVALVSISGEYWLRQWQHLREIASCLWGWW